MQLTKEHFDNEIQNLYDRLDKRIDEKLDKKLVQNLKNLATKSDLNMVRLIVDNLSAEFSSLRDYVTIKFTNLETEVKEINVRLDTTSKMAKEDVDALAKNYLTLDRRVMNHDLDIKKLKENTIVK